MAKTCRRPSAPTSSAAEQEYFVDGMVEEITMAISRLPWLFVIARNSSFAYKGKSVDVAGYSRLIGRTRGALSKR
jgi:adenylate cyclase